MIRVECRDSSTDAKRVRSPRVGKGPRAKMSGGIFKTADIAQFESTHRESETRGSAARRAERLRLSGNALSVVLQPGEA